MLIFLVKGVSDVLAGRVKQDIMKFFFFADTREFNVDTVSLYSSRCAVCLPVLCRADARAQLRLLGRGAGHREARRGGEFFPAKKASDPCIGQALTCLVLVMSWGTLWNTTGQVCSIFFGSL